MKSKFLVIFVIVLLISLPLLSYSFFSKPQIEESPDVFVGVDVAYADIAAIKSLIDEISPFTNIFVIGSTGISYNTTKLDETCQYVYEKGLYFIIFIEKPLRVLGLEDAKTRWGDRFLGFYVFDELGGRQLDLVENQSVVLKANNYSDATSQFVSGINDPLSRYVRSNNNATSVLLFTSDYALYWFDYKAGYDVVFAEFGWNYSRQLNVALNRGAATVQNKDWGIMITWTYNHPPYIESGKELYDDLILAYNNGAKYILVFDTNKNYTEGILEQEHIETLEQFWQYTIDNPRSNGQDEKRVAFVLPKGYGYGFRGPEDKIWGLWEADALSLEISYHLGNFLEEYGTKLDIIYDDDFELHEVYSKYIFWNGTIISE